VSQEATYHLQVANNEIMQGRCEASFVARCENGLLSVRCGKGSEKTGACETIWFREQTTTRASGYDMSSTKLDCVDVTVALLAVKCK